VSGSPPPQMGNSSSAREDSDETPVPDKVGMKGKKKKRNKGEDVMTKVVKTMSDGLRNSDKMFLELEGKRLKVEEQQKHEE